MRNLAWTVRVVALALTALPAAGNSMVMKGQLDKTRDEQVAVSRQKEELQNHATRLDRDKETSYRLQVSRRRTDLPCLPSRSPGCHPCFPRDDPYAALWGAIWRSTGEDIFLLSEQSAVESRLLLAHS